MSLDYKKKFQKTKLKSYRGNSSIYSFCLPAWTCYLTPFYYLHI